MASVLGFAFTPAAVHRAAIQQNDDHEHKSADGPLVNRFYFVPKSVVLLVHITTKVCFGVFETKSTTLSGVLRLLFHEEIKVPMRVLFCLIRENKKILEWCSKYPS